MPSATPECGRTASQYHGRSTDCEGSDRYDDDLKSLLRSSGFTWSGYAHA
jgi:hypothetical protein